MRPRFSSSSSRAVVFWSVLSSRWKVRPPRRMKVLKLVENERCDEVRNGSGEVGA